MTASLYGALTCFASFSFLYIPSMGHFDTIKNSTMTTPKTVIIALPHRPLKNNVWASAAAQTEVCAK
jgi:hypothetical protein